MTEHILSSSELSELDGRVDEFKKSVSSIIREFNTIINSFSSKGVVQSLFISGNFGEEQKSKLQSITSILNDYYETICGTGQLIDVTKEFISEQKARVDQ